MAATGGDRELVIGNKQLISLFFVVVALCGVFFAMGYMIGRNSTRTSLAADGGGTVALQSGQRQQPEPPRETAAAQPETETPAPDRPSPAESGTGTPGGLPGAGSGVDTRPALDTAPAAARSDPPPAPVAPAEAAKPVRPVSTGITTVSTPEPGASYLQVTALPRLDADGVVKTLREQSFPTILATSSKDGLYRVLVGPYRQTSQLADAKARLKSIGFGSAFVQKQ